jgi:hypothetical protein
MTDQTLRFKTKLLQTGKTTTGIELPGEVIQQLAAGAKPALLVKVNNYTYRTTAGVMGGLTLLPFSAQHREASGLKGGDSITVDVSVDREPRTIELPDDFAKALAAKPGLKAAFEKLAPSRRKAEALNVLDAKTPETRARRIAAILAKLDH